MFYTGQKVVHVGFPPDSIWERIRAWWHPIPDQDDPVVGEIYTVVNVIGTDDGTSLELLELKSPGDEWWVEGHSSDGFRPAVTKKKKKKKKKKTSIAVFKKMLAPTKVRALT